MPFKPPLALEKLTDIQDRNRDNPDVKALLWEIKRYHAIAARCDQILRCYAEGGHGMVPSIVMDLLALDLKDEPCLQQLRDLRAAEKLEKSKEVKKYRHPSELP